MIKSKKVYLKRNFDDAIHLYNQYFRNKSYRIVLNDSLSYDFSITDIEFVKHIGVPPYQTERLLEIIDKNSPKSFIATDKINNRSLAFLGIKNIFNTKSTAYLFHDSNEEVDNLVILTTNILNDKKSLSLIVFIVKDGHLELADIDYKTKNGGKHLITNKYLYILKTIDNYQHYLISEVKAKEKSIT